MHCDIAPDRRLSDEDERHLFAGVAPASSRVVHALALPVHAPVLLSARLFGRTALVCDLADAFLFCRSVCCDALVIDGIFCQGGAGSRKQAQGDCAGENSVQYRIPQHLRG